MQNLIYVFDTRCSDGYDLFGKFSISMAHVRVNIVGHIFQQFEGKLLEGDESRE